MLSPHAFIIASALWEWSHFKDLSVFKSKVACRVWILISSFMRDLFSKCSMALCVRSRGWRADAGMANRFWINNWGTRRDYQIFHTFCRPSILFCMITQLDVSSPCPWDFCVPLNLSLQTNDNINLFIPIYYHFQLFGENQSKRKIHGLDDVRCFNDEFEVCNRWK